tara:strand:+ start:6800 stop:7042 length:243 start_codon:yes stop_codon:yes gene_type:complete
MANIKAKISSVATKSRMTSSIPVRAKVIDVGSVTSLGAATDVDLSSVADGAILQYNASTNKFQATTSLNNANLSILGGGF